MRKFVFACVAALVVFSFTFTSQASAQGLFLGAGATIPTSDYGNYADPGWMLEGGVSFPINEEGLYIFGEGLFGSNKHSDFEGDKTNLLGIFGGVEYDLSTPGEPGIFIFGEVGLLRHDYKSDEFPEDEGADNGLAYGGGAGYGFPIGGMSGWVLGRYLVGQFDGPDGNTTFFGVMAGVSFPLGGN
jgi:hypothetical protein